MQDIKKIFGQRIKTLRIEQGLSQEALAIAAGIDRTYLPAIEKGKRNVSLEVIEKLAKGLQVSIIQLFD
jgi:transcriptional regulator with XRE-family HTH domain